MPGRKGKGIKADWDELLPQKASKTPAKRGHGGQPVPYDQAQADYVIDQMEIYGRSMLSICEDAQAPTRHTFFKWMERHAELRERYARARESLADHAADMIAELAETVTPETAVADRVKLDALKWRAERLKPRTYSPTQRTEQTGPGGGPIQVATVQTVDVMALDPDAREALKQALLAAKKGKA